MAAHFDKARELADLIIQSEESLRLADARAAYRSDTEAVAKMQEYTAYQSEVQTVMKNGEMNSEQFKEATKKMTEMGAELKSDPVIGELIKCENEFNSFVNQIIDVLKATITGVVNDCDKNCGGCKGCGR